MKTQPSEPPTDAVFPGEPAVIFVGRSAGEIRTGGAPRCPACERVQSLACTKVGRFNRCPGCQCWFWFEVQEGWLYPYLTNLEGPFYRPTLTSKPRGRRRRKGVAHAQA